MSTSSDDKSVETRVSGVLAFVGSAALYFFVTDSVFAGANVDVRWLLVLFVPTGLAMIFLPRVWWLQKH